MIVPSAACGAPCADPSLLPALRCAQEHLSGPGGTRTIPLLQPLHLTALTRLDSKQGLRVLGSYVESRAALDAARPAGVLLGQLLQAFKAARQAPRR